MAHGPLGSKYTCANCGETFLEGQSEEAANAEAEMVWGVKNSSTNPAMAKVCDDCWKEIVKWEDTWQRSHSQRRS